METTFFASFQNLIQTFSAGFNDWGGLHPLVVHMPIGILFVAPLFIAAGLIFNKSCKTFLISALVLLILGTAGTYLAVSTGEEASEAVKVSGEVLATLEAHDHLAEKMRLHFSLLTLIFLAYILFYGFLNSILGPRIHQLALILFLVFYAYSLVLLAYTAHLGGKMVHHHGVTSKLFLNVDKDIINLKN